MARPRVFVQRGQRFGRGVVTEPEATITENGRRRRAAIMLCDCGRTYVSSLTSIRRGATSSCGCRRKDARPPSDKRTELMRAAASRHKHQRLLDRIAGGWKRCPHCGRTLSLEGDFTVKRASADGRSAWCRDCTNAKRRYERHDGQQQCRACGEWKPEAEFMPVDGSRTRTRLSCEACCEKRARLRERTEPVADLAAARAAITWKRPAPVLELVCCGGQERHEPACPMRSVRRELLLA